MDYFVLLKDNQKNFFKFMNEKYPLFYNSNVFLRDIEYAIKSYFVQKERKLNYNSIQKITQDFINLLESENKLVRVSQNSWKINFKLKEPIQSSEVKTELKKTE